MHKGRPFQHEEDGWGRGSTFCEGRTREVLSHRRDSRTYKTLYRNWKISCRIPNHHFYDKCPLFFFIFYLTRTVSYTSKVSSLPPSLLWRSPFTLDSSGTSYSPETPVNVGPDSTYKRYDTSFLNTHIYTNVSLTNRVDSLLRDKI